jgi:tetratricopeptide (TPR) repeat protein
MIRWIWEKMPEGIADRAKDFRQGARRFLARASVRRLHMRRLSVLGAMMAGLLLAGCAAQSTEHKAAWDNIIAEDYNAARAQYESILAESPNDPYANLNIGVAYEELGDNANAAKHYQIAIANGAEAEIQQVAQDGQKASRRSTVKQVAEENLARING